MSWLGHLWSRTFCRVVSVLMRPRCAFFDSFAASQLTSPRYQFDRHVPDFYPLVTDILTKEVALEMRLAVREYLHRVGTVKGFVRELAKEPRETVLWSPGRL